MIIITLDTIQTLILAVFLYLLGGFLKKILPIFNKLCIPSPVIGGLLFCILNLILNILNIASISMNTNLMPYFMTFFFTIIGLGVNISLIKKGGKSLIVYWILCGILACSQNFLTIILSRFIGIHPLLGLMCGTISMEGGHGCAAAFGSTIESLGISGATTIGVAAATFGLILGGIIGGPIAKFLIDIYKLKPKNTITLINPSLLKQQSTNYTLSPLVFFKHLLLILISIKVGEFITDLFYKSSNIILPVVVGCMIVAVLFRSINDKIKVIELDYKLLDFLNEISLGMFLTMALMSIDLFKLSNLFGPILILVFSQVIFIVIFSIFICFRALGRDFDAAIMISGLIGHGLGATPNALANMNSVAQKYGHSEKAFLVVPLVGAFLLDLFTMPCIIIFINLLS